MQFWQDLFPVLTASTSLNGLDTKPEPSHLTCILVCISTIKPPTQRRLRK